MTVKDIKDLIKAMDESNLAELQFKNKDIDIKLRSKEFFENKGKTIVSAPMPMATPIASPVASPTAPAPVAKSEATDSTAPASSGKLIEIKSPMVGTFYRSSSPDKPAFVSVGDSIAKGGVVCIIEAMKLFNEIESEVSGKIVKVMVEDAQPVEYDQVLFLVEP